MAQYRVLRVHAGEQIPPMLPPEYRERARTLLEASTDYAVVLFGHDRRDVVLSGSVRRALARVPAEVAVLAVGANFTREATALLEARNAKVARLGEFHWTDESFIGIQR